MAQYLFNDRSHIDLDLFLIVQTIVVVWTGRGHVEAIDAVEWYKFVAKIPIGGHVIAHICQHNNVFH